MHHVSPMRSQKRVRLQVVAAALALTIVPGCGFGPLTGPTPKEAAPVVLGPKPDVSGLWRGSVTVADCWRTQGDGPDPCADRGGRAAPLVLNISHFRTPVPATDLLIVFEAFVPVATGTCYGTRDATGAIFFQGVLRRVDDEFDARLTFRGQIEGNRIESLEELIDVNVTLKNGAGWQLLQERWTFAPILRQ